MNTPLLGLPLSAPLPSKLRNKRVLLVDASSAKRDLRAESMRKLGMEVDCAADISEARSWWRADLYSLVLIDMESGMGHRDKFCDDMRRATPPQQISFFVGKPGYLADAPNADRTPMVQRSGDQSVREDIRAALAPNLLGEVSQRWGIMEASRRISAVRTLSHARSSATQEKPAPSRDLETREFKRAAAEGRPAETRPAENRTLDDLLREEMQ
jgi:CheY-like chemotaxis protein